jgi:hypothetical protein
MEITRACKPRRIIPSSTITPLLVPSFSSKGFHDIKHLHEYVSEHIPDTSLISAYDVYHEKILEEKIYQSDLVFIDSGGYESSVDIELSEIYNKEYIPKLWSFETFKEQILKLEPLTNIALVNYDNAIEKYSLEVQVERANDLFYSFPKYAKVFLYKPTRPNEDKLDIDLLCSKIEKMACSSIIGVTEKELGSSILERCKNIIRIRESMEKIGLQIPIHIFGCLDPLNIIAYFVCGADIFDGLSWLRFSFIDGVGCYINSYAITSGNWSLNDQRLKAIVYGNNLKELTLLMNRMRHFSKTYDWESFELSARHVAELKKLVSQAGLIIQ